MSAAKARCIHLPEHQNKKDDRADISGGTRFFPTNQLIDHSKLDENARHGHTHGACLDLGVSRQIHGEHQRGEQNVNGENRAVFCFALCHGFTSAASPHL